MAFPPIEPYDHGLLDTDDGQLIYWETCGNPDGKPVLVVHGGPGSGCSIGNRRAFDPERFRIILFDQRGCGRSRPHAGDPATDMSTNTTEHLLRDMERLRVHLGVEKWLLYGGSWGVTLSLAYAQRHPARVSEMVLISVTTSTRADIDWLYHGVARYFPEAHERFLAGVPEARTAAEVLPAYARRMNDPDPVVRERAAVDWCDWEDAVISMESNGRPGAYGDRPGPAKLAFVRICAHYFANGAWLEEGQIQRDVDPIAHIPAVLIHGRHDLGGPVATAWRLAREWPAADLIVVEDSGHTGSLTMRDHIDAAVARFTPA